MYKYHMKSRKNWIPDNVKRSILSWGKSKKLMFQIYEKPKCDKRTKLTFRHNAQPTLVMHFKLPHHSSR